MVGRVRVRRKGERVSTHLEVEAVDLVVRPEARVRPGERVRVVARLVDQLRGHRTRGVAAPAPARVGARVVLLAEVVPHRVPERGVHLEARAPAVAVVVVRVGVADGRLLLVEGQRVRVRVRVRLRVRVRVRVRVSVRARVRARV